MFEWITTTIESLGYFGIFALMVLDHLFQPILSELIMLLSGFVSNTSDRMNLATVILVGHWVVCLGIRIRPGTGVHFSYS